jgi:hypothetical protein
MSKGGVTPPVPMLKRTPPSAAQRLGVRTAVIGLIDGIAETTASLLKIFFGALMALRAGVLFARLIK